MRAVAFRRGAVRVRRPLLVGESGFQPTCEPTGFQPVEHQLLSSPVFGFSRTFDTAGEFTATGVWPQRGQDGLRWEAKSAAPGASDEFASSIKSAGEPVTDTLSSGLFGTLHAIAST